MPKEILEESTSQEEKKDNSSNIQEKLEESNRGQEVKIMEKMDLIKKDIEKVLSADPEKIKDQKGAIAAFIGKNIQNIESLINSGGTEDYIKKAQETKEFLESTKNELVANLTEEEIVKGEEEIKSSGTGASSSHNYANIKKSQKSSKNGNRIF